MNSKKIVSRRQSKRRTGRILAGLLIVLLVGLGSAYYTGYPPFLFGKPAATTGPDYHTATVRRGSIAISAAGTGVLVAGQSVDLSFSARGAVSELNVKPGDTVTAGEVLARMSNTQSLDAAVASDQLTLLQDQQALAALQQNAGVSLANAYLNLIKAQQTYDDALASEQRDVYARCSDAVNTKYKSQLDAATEKLQKIIKSGGYGTDPWINAQNNYQQALANYNYCIAYTPAEKTQYSASLQVAQVSLQQAQNTYNVLNVSKGVDPNALSLAEAKINQDQAQLAQDQQNQKGTTLTAPFNGTVTFVASGVGSMVDTSTFMTISDLSHPTLNISIDETDLSKLTAGSNAEVVFDALPDQTFTGKVTQVDPQLTTSGQYQVATGVVALDPSAASALRTLPIGLNATVTIIDQQAKNALIVPLSAVRDLGGGQYGVFVAGRNGQLQLRFVQVGIKNSTDAQIVSGLQAGEMVSTGQIATINNQAGQNQNGQ